MAIVAPPQNLPSLSDRKAPFRQRVMRLAYGRKLPHEVHRLQSASPTSMPTDVVSLVLRSPESELPAAIRLGLDSRELTPSALTQVFSKLKHYGRFDKASQIARHFVNTSGKTLALPHYVLLMSIASAAAKWTSALEYWDDMTTRARLSPNSAAYGAYFAACRAGGRWDLAAVGFSDMLRDRHVVDSKAAHALMNGFRRSGRWQLSIAAFHQAVEVGQLQPDYGVYRELLLTIEDAAKLRKHRGGGGSARAYTGGDAGTSSECSADMLSSDGAMTAATSGGEPREAAAGAASSNEPASTVEGMAPKFEPQPPELAASPSTSVAAAASWHHAMAIAAAVTTVVPLNAGIYNVAMRCCVLDGQWRRAVALFHDMKQRSVQSNAATYDILTSANPRNLTFQRALLRLVRQDAMPVPKELWRALFTCLCRQDKSSVLLALVGKLQDDCIDDPTNLNVSWSDVLTALLEALLTHPRPEDALTTGKELHSSLIPVAIEASVGLSSYGDAAHQWIVEGRVAVVDYMTLTWDLTQSLTQHYDSCVAPFTAAMVLARNATQKADADPKKKRAGRALAFLGDEVQAAASRQAASWKITGNGAANDADRSGDDDEDDDDDDLLEGAAPLRAARVAQRLAGSGRHQGHVRVMTVHHQLVANGHLARWAEEKGVYHATPRGAGGESTPAAKVPGGSGDAQLLERLRQSGMSAVSPINLKCHSVAVGLMLQALNPDAEVHVVSVDASVRALAKAAGLVATALSTDELMRKAPTTTASSSISRGQEEAARWSPGGKALPFASSGSLPGKGGPSLLRRGIARHLLRGSLSKNRSTSVSASDMINPA